MAKTGNGWPLAKLVSRLHATALLIINVLAGRGWAIIKRNKQEEILYCTAEHGVADP